MPNAHNAAICYVNLADGGQITVSSAPLDMLGSRLQDRHIGRKWRALAPSGWVSLDLGGVQLIDTVAMLGLTLTAAGTTRVRASAVSPGAGELYDSGTQVGQVDARYGSLICLLPQPVMARYVRIDLADASLTHIDAGRLVVGARYQFQRNFAYNWTRGRVDRSRPTESRGGQVFISKDNSYRTVSISFDAVPEGEDEIIEDIDRICGQSSDVLLILNPEAQNLGRDSIWGLMASLEPLAQPYFNTFTKSFTIRETL